MALLGVQSQGFLSWLPILENEKMVFKDKAVLLVPLESRGSGPGRDSSHGSS